MNVFVWKFRVKNLAKKLINSDKFLTIIFILTFKILDAGIIALAEYVYNMQ